MFCNSKLANTAMRHEIRFGDRIYVRVIQEGRTRLELSIDNASGMTDLIGEIRYSARRLEGLAKLFIRNHSRGWSEERPIKFYPDGATPRFRYRNMEGLLRVSR